MSSSCTLLALPMGLGHPLSVPPQANNFERAMVDEFEIVEMDVGEILHISIGHDNSGAGAAWHLQQVEIFHPILEKTYYFPCNEWLEKESCKKTLKPGSEADGGPVQYRVTVHTTDCRGAGTDSDISCIVYGAQGDTGTQKLDNSTNNFEKGQVSLS